MKNFMQNEPQNEIKTKAEKDIFNVFLENKEKLIDPKEVEKNNQILIQQYQLKKLFIKKLRQKGFYRKERAIVHFLVIFALGLPLGLALLTVFIISKENISLLILLSIPVISLLSLVEITINKIFDISEMRLKESLDNFDYSKVHELL